MAPPGQPPVNLPPLDQVLPNVSYGPLPPLPPINHPNESDAYLSNPAPAPAPVRDGSSDVEITAVSNKPANMKTIKENLLNSIESIETPELFAFGSGLNTLLPLQISVLGIGQIRTPLEEG